MSKPETAVLYHNDADGFGAAYAYWVFNQKEDIHYQAVQYGQPFPTLPDSVKHVYVVDFSYDRETTLAMQDRFHTFVTIDHHKTAEQALNGLPQTVFDMSKSGCVLTWEYFSAGTTVPLLLEFIQDRDLWQWELSGSEEVNLGLSAISESFEVWSRADVDDLYSAGKAIKAFRGKQVESSAKGIKLVSFLGHRNVPVANVTANISEHGHQVLQDHPAAPFSVSYFDTVTEDGSRKRVYSMRSSDYREDVGALARKCGGGGHRNAAGFSEILEEEVWP